MSSESAYADKAQLAAAGIAGAPSVALPFEFEAPIAFHGVSIFPHVRIGRHSYMNGGMIRSRVHIGRFCSIGRNVVLSAGDHPLDALTTHPVAWQARAPLRRPETSQRRPRPVVTEIGHDVWIGDNVVVMSGVSVGTGAVIGANAVVTRDVAPYAIVAGAPARVLRPRFEPEIAARIEALCWWDWPDERLREAIPDMQAMAIGDFLDRWEKR